MNIYFSGSIKGGRQLVDNYCRIIEFLKPFGNVLTEHIGDVSYAAKGYRIAEEVYKEDKSLMDKSDVVIADVTVPSLGVGYELAYCEARKIPVLCLYCGSRESVSSMIIGNAYFICEHYTDLTEAFMKIENFIKNIQKKELK